MKIKKVYLWEKPIRPNRLPSAYQEVEYIQGTGTQYIDTWIAWSLSLKTELKLNSQLLSESAIFWSSWALNGNFLMFYQNKIRWHSANTVDVSCVLNTDYVIKTENWKLTVDWTGYTCNASWSVNTSNVYIRRTNVWQWSYAYWRFKLYYMKMLNWNTLVRYFVPCYRISDSVIWLYDLVNNVFYTNLWSGTFTKWQDV